MIKVLASGLLTLPSGLKQSLASSSLMPTVVLMAAATSNPESKTQVIRRYCPRNLVSAEITAKCTSFDMTLTEQQLKCVSVLLTLNQFLTGTSLGHKYVMGCLEEE